ncbi:MAG: hypothetical protein KJI69_02500 [Patescibacteria group bacterium]|nr:hypothetical protein [Patescibacteria group bacterium]
MQKYPGYYYKYKVCVSGAAEMYPCTPTAKKNAIEVGRQIVKQGAVLVTGATTGIPYWSAVGAKKAGGISIGFSPAATEKAHVKSYRLPIDMFDVMVYTGFGYAGRNLLLTRASDGVIIICGRIGTLNEFTVAFEDEKPIGVLEGSGGTADRIDSLFDDGYRGKRKIVGAEDPKILVRETIKMIKKDRGDNIKGQKKK